MPQIDQTTALVFEYVVKSGKRQFSQSKQWGMMIVRGNNLRDSVQAE